MSKNKDKNIIYIISIISCIDKIKLYTEEFKDHTSFLNSNDQLNYNASLTLLLTIGEESKKIDSNIKAKFNNVEWENISGVRNIIAHEYLGINPLKVWNIINIYLEPLKKTMIEILNTEFDNIEMINEILKSNFYKHIEYLKIEI